MGTFDAGSIEAKLVLDRSDFDRGLREAQAKVDKFESTDAEAKVTVDADTAEASAQIAKIEAEIKSLEDAKVNVDIDAAVANAQIDKLKVKLASIRNAHAKIDVDAGGATETIAKVKSEIATIPERHTTKLNIEEGNGVSRTQAFISAIIAGLPLIPPLAAAGGAAIVGLAASLTAAAGGAAVLGLGIFGAIKAFQGLKGHTDRMPASMRAFQSALQGMQGAFDTFTRATQNASFDLMAKGLNIIAALLPRLIPIFNAFAAVASGALTSVGNWFAGPEGTAMLNWFRTFGALQFGTILSILGNLGRTLLNVMQAFSPFATTMMNGLNNLTASWVTASSTMAQSSGFKSFMAYVNQVGPMVVEAIASLGRALIAIGVAIAPLGPPLLSLITAFGNLISTMNPTVLRTIILAVGGLVLAWTAFEAVASVVRAGLIMFNGLMAAVRVATLAWTAAQWLLNAALLANPIGIVIVAIAALVAALVLLWQHSETFRKGWTDAWNLVKTVTLAVWSALTAAFSAWRASFTAGWSQVVGFMTSVGSSINNAIRTAWNSAFAFMTAIGTSINNAVRTAWNAVVNATTSAGNTIRNAVVSAWNAIRNAVVAAGNAIRTAVTTAWNVIRTVVTSILRSITSVVSQSMTGWRIVITGAMGIIRGVVTTGWNAIRSVVTSVSNSIRSTISSVWSSIRSVISSAVSAVRSVVSSGFNAARSAAVSAFNSLRSGASSAINGLVGVVSGAVGRIRGFFAGAGSWLWNAGWSIINGLISGIRAGIGALGSALGGIGSFIASHKGPPSYDRVMLRPHGRMIMGGLIRGLNDQIPKLGGALQNVTDRISGIQPRMGVNMVGGGPSLGSGVTVNFHNYYPVAEQSSSRATRQMKELSVLGVFSG